MDEKRQLIRFELGGQWSADDLGRMLVSISDLYDLRLFLEILRDDRRDFESSFLKWSDFQRLDSGREPFVHWRFTPLALGFLGLGPPPLDETRLARLPQILLPADRLGLHRITYASPGAADLFGIGEVVGHIKDFVLKLIERKDLKRQRKLSDERAELENQGIRIENARNFVALGRDLGYTKTELRRLAAHVDDKQETLFGLIAQQKLLSVSSIDEAGKGSK